MLHLRWASLAFVLVAGTTEVLPGAQQRARLLVPLAQLETRVISDSLDTLAHYDLALGYWGFVQLTVGHVRTPSGRFIQRRYQGLAIEQYYALAGTAGVEHDTLQVFHTDGGREVRGGGGIAPDLPVPAAARPPTWWSVAADSGYDDAVADSVAMTLSSDPAARAAWLTAPAEWQTRLLPPFLSLVRARLSIRTQPDSATGLAIARRLAARAASVRWPPDAGTELMLKSDPDIRAALDAFPRLPELLRGPATKP